MMMELKEGMVFKNKNKYYVLALIQNERYLFISDDENYGWDFHESSNYEQITNSKAYNGYIPIHNGKQYKFVTGWWYGERQVMATLIYVGDLEEVKHHFIVKDNMLDLYLRVKDDVSISLDETTNKQKYNVGDKVKICDKKTMKDYMHDRDHDVIYDMFQHCDKEMTVKKVIYDSEYNDYFYIFEESCWKFHEDFLVDNDINVSFDGVTSVQADEFIESFTEIFKNDDKKEEQKETISLKVAIEYAELINNKVEEILQILDILDENGVAYTFTDDYFEVSVDNRHYTITFNKR